jgi:hypothetical protein
VSSSPTSGCKSEYWIWLWRRRPRIAEDGEQRTSVFGLNREMVLPDRDSFLASAFAAWGVPDTTATSRNPQQEAYSTATYAPLGGVVRNFLRDQLGDGRVAQRRIGATCR